MFNTRKKLIPPFTSPRERRLWLYSFMVLVAIFLTLVLGQPLLGLLGDQNIQAAIFLLVMILIGATIIAHGLKSQPGKIEIVIWLGFIAVYLMVFLRLGLAERSHLMEYSVLAIFIHKALRERVNQGKQVPSPALLAFLITFILGVLDECIQIFLPSRVFDYEDIVFNGLAAFTAIGTSMLLQWAGKKFGDNK